MRGKEKTQIFMLIRVDMEEGGASRSHRSACKDMHVCASRRASTDSFIRSDQLFFSSRLRAKRDREALGRRGAAVAETRTVRHTARQTDTR